MTDTLCPSRALRLNNYLTKILKTKIMKKKSFITRLSLKLAFVLLTAFCSPNLSSAQTHNVSFGSGGNGIAAPGFILTDQSGTISFSPSDYYSYTIEHKSGSGFTSNPVSLTLNGTFWGNGSPLQISSSPLPLAIYATVPSTTPCNQGRQDIMVIHFYNSHNNDICDYTYTVGTTLQSLSGPSVFCGKDGSATYSITSNIYLNGPFNWTSSNPAFTITGNGTSTVTVRAQTIPHGTTTLCVSGGNLCQQKCMVIAKGVPDAPTNGWFEMNDLTGHCWSTAFVNSVNGATSYIWTSPASVTTTIPSNPRHLLPGNVYSISVSTNNICGTSSVYNYTGTAITCNAAMKANSGTTSTDETNELSIFPNPANTSFEISLPDHENSVRIIMTNIAGQVIKDFTTNESKTVIESSDIPAGLYIININSDEINTVSKIQIVK